MVLALIFIFISCSENSSLTSPVTFKGVTISSSSKIETVAFTSYDIKSMNGTTGEIDFFDSKTAKRLSEYKKLNCYLGVDSLFTVNLTSDILSSIDNNLVLNLNSNNGTYYFADGYPVYIDNLGLTTLRAKNKENRATVWALFIAILKTEGKYKE